MERIRTIILDDHGLFRAGLISLLKLNSKIEVVGDAANGTEGLELVRTTKPNIVLLDISFPEENGTDICRSILKMETGARVIMLTMHTGEEYLAASLVAGAEGYVLKDAAVAELTTAIIAVHNGKKYVSADMMDKVLDVFQSSGLNRPLAREPHGPLSALSSRELEILKLVGFGADNRAIAEHLKISASTVKKHRSNIMKKLNIHKTTDLIMYAIRNGLNRSD
ncbi:MAG: response regulator transcription factor [Candidatus Neomarinimicrobiota bacterium]